MEIDGVVNSDRYQGRGGMWWRLVINSLRLIGTTFNININNDKFKDKGRGSWNNMMMMVLILTGGIRLLGELIIVRVGHRLLTVMIMIGILE